MNEKRMVTGIALVEIVQIEQKKSLLSRMFSGDGDFSARVRLLAKHGHADLPNELEIPASRNHDKNLRFVLYVNGSEVIDSDPFIKERVEAIDPFKYEPSQTNYNKTGLLSLRMVADLWIGKCMPSIESKPRI